ncbi:MAG: Polyketide cyclase / dehydrase and lipid transport [Rhodobacteraceae bacterium HLUCCA08]|nr:MAG: Polyketide cyclase / dehydrase and lipid transport [Rhodobacteraceae bacterium HLUCCA08]
MKTSAHEDIEAPADHVFARVSDFASFERMLMRRGADVTRVDLAMPPVVGSGWEVRFRFRGKGRCVRAVLDRLEPPNGMTIGFEGDQIKGAMEIELVPLSPARTRLSLTVTTEAKTLAARLLLQSMRLGKGRVEGRLGKALAGFSEDLERKYRDGAA